MNKAMASRASFGEKLVDLGKGNNDVVVLDADLSKSTMSALFAKEFPNRFFDMGIAEANMIGTAAGLALSGKIPFICSFACFLTGRYDIIRMSIAYCEANVKLIGTHAGVAIGPDGNSQQGLEDISIMRSLPNMAVIQPGDHIETLGAIEYAAQHKGAMFIRLTRQKLQPVNPDNYKFEFGKGVVLKEGNDLTLIATGGTLYNTLEAAKQLESEGISTRVVNIHTIKPIDKDLIIKCAKETKKLITVEDHNIIGGLGSAVSEVVTEYSPCLVKRIGLQDCFGESGDEKELYEKFGLDTNSIVKTTKEFISQSQTVQV